MKKPMPKSIQLFLALTVLLMVSNRSPAQALFVIEENGKFGYIDSTGKVIIQPIFRSAHDFAEGMASVRIDGKYGFINTTGKFVIQPVYDYATFFSEGLAIAFKNGKPFYINKNGSRAFANGFERLEPFKNGKAKVGTMMHRGYINKNGNLIIDTVYTDIHPFVEGFAVVQKLFKKEGAKWAVIDTTGTNIFPFGKYAEIGDLTDGYFQVEILRDENDSTGNGLETGFVDKTGKLAFLWDRRNKSFVEGTPHCGMVRISLYKYWIKEDPGTWSSNNSYTGFSNMKGDIVVDNTSYKYSQDFSDNRAFVRGDDNKSYIINTKGELVVKESFSDIKEVGFTQGLAFVQESETSKWGVIDTNAKFVVSPQFDDIYSSGFVNDSFFFFENKTGGNHKLTGISKKDGAILIDPIMDAVDRAGFKNGLIKCLIKDRLSYINMHGDIVWQQKNNTPGLTTANIDRMNRGYFYATSEGNKGDLGGFGRSDNVAKETKGNKANNGLSLTVTKNDSVKFGNEYYGLRVQLNNNSKRDFFFGAQDSRLYMKVQAKTETGDWKDIEYLPSSWCGNSYHTLTLKPEQYWEFVTPQYEGEFKTKLRIELKYMEKEPKGRLGGKEKTLYSNEYEGSVNPGQFWRKETYYPNGIMDPYND